MESTMDGQFCLNRTYTLSVLWELPLKLDNALTVHPRWYRMIQGIPET